MASWARSSATDRLPDSTYVRATSGRQVVECLADRLHRLVADFRSDARSRIEQLREAAAAGDRDSVGRIAHMLRGSSAMLGAGRVSQTCASIESVTAARGTDELGECLAELENALTLTGQRLEAQLVSVTSDQVRST